MHTVLIQVISWGNFPLPESQPPPEDHQKHTQNEKIHQIYPPPPPICDPPEHGV